MLADAAVQATRAEKIVGGGPGVSGFGPKVGAGEGLGLTGPLALHEPGVEMDPSKEAAVSPVAGFFTRVTSKLPVAPSNRPVPPSMVAVSRMVRTFGAVNRACPTMV